MLRYGDLTASGKAGGLAGEKVDVAWAVETRHAATKRPKRERFIVKN